MKKYTTTVAGTCEALGLGRTKVFELLAKGDLKRIKVGRRTLVTTKSIRQIAKRG